MGKNERIVYRLIGRLELKIVAIRVFTGDVVFSASTSCKGCDSCRTKPSVFQVFNR